MPVLSNVCCVRIPLLNSVVGVCPQAKLKEVEKIVNPIMQKVYQAAGGAPGGAGGDDDDFGSDEL